MLSCLPRAQREVMEVMECIAGGLDRDEIAEVLGKTKEAIRRTLCDARRRLREELHPNGEHKQPPRRMARSPREEDR